MGDYESNGLMEDALNRAYERPVSAIAVEMSQLRATYQVGEPIPVTMAVRSLGTYPVAVPTIDCQEVVYGQCRVALAAPPGVDPPIAPGHGRRIARMSFGGRQDGRIRDELSPEALTDLDRFVILQPGETYAIPWSPTVVGDRRGRRYLSAYYMTQARYSLSAINQALSAPFADGVCIWESPWIDIVK
jgi:hypothetical protein